MSGRKEHTKAESGHVKPEAEIGVIWPQARGCQEPPEAGIGREGFSLEPLEEKLTP